MTEVSCTASVSAAQEIGFECGECDGQVATSVIMQTASFKPRKIEFCLQDNASRFAFEGLLEAFEIANELVGHDFYLVSVHAGLDAMCRNFSELGSHAFHDTLIFVGGYNDRWYAEDCLISRLRCRCHHAARTSFVGSGIFLAEVMGLLENRRAAIHPNFHSILKEEIFNLNAVDVPLWIEGNMSTATGGIAGVRIAMEFIRSDLGEHFFRSVSEYLGNQSSDTGAKSIEDLKWDCATHDDPLVGDCIKHMRDNLEDPVAIGDIAKIFGVSQRQIERKFRTLLNNTPCKVYRYLRLEFARGLVRQSRLPLLDIGLASGFGCHASFKKSYKIMFGLTPFEERKSKVLVSYSPNVGQFSA